MGESSINEGFSIAYDSWKVGIKPYDFPVIRDGWDIASKVRIWGSISTNGFFSKLDYQRLSTSNGVYEPVMKLFPDAGGWL